MHNSKPIKIMKKSLLFLVAALVIQACSSNPNEFSIKGTYKNADNEKVTLLQLKTDGMKKIDSVKLETGGEFQFTGYTNIPTFFVVQADKSKTITLLVKPGDNISLKANLNNFQGSYDIKGSKDSRKIMKLRRNLESNIAKLDSLGKFYKQNPNNENSQKLRSRLNKVSNEIVQKQKDYTKRFIDNNLNSMVSLMALYQQIGPRSYVLDPRKDFEYFEKVDSALMNKYPNSGPVKSLHSQVEQMKQQRKAEKESAKRLAIGQKAPEIALPNPAGDTIALSSLRGQYVLLDFWASWCKPCRVENPNLVKAYKRYNDKGFEIYQVSLDKKRASWEKAIEKDNLSWTHVSDLKFWNSSAAKTYNIRSIPANFLLNEKGEIIDKNLRGDALQKKLHEIFSKQ
jgi:peroxiredoxin